MYIYDTHVHSQECSACSHSSAREMVRVYKAAGYSGIVLTNHFYRGNTAVDRNLPWKDFASAYYNTYLEAKDEGDKLDFDVIFGIEEYIGDHKEYLIYNIDLDFLLKNPDMPKLSVEELCRRVHDAGGFVSFAHPYRFRSEYMDRFVEPDFSYVDAIEAVNACNTPEQNERAIAAAKELGLVVTCGSDTHKSDQIVVGKSIAGMAFSHRVKTGAELVAALNESETKPFVNGKIIDL